MKFEPEDWKNPINKVRAPKVAEEPLEPMPLDVVSALIKACKLGSFSGDRDATILLALLDTGTRSGEFLAINLEDINQARGDILIRQGKGRKPRTVYIGKNSKKAVRRYLKHRRDRSPALWVTHPRYGSNRMSYDGLRGVLTRLAKAAEVPESPACTTSGGRSVLRC